MRMFRNFNTKHVVLSLGLAGLLAAAGGCSETSDVTQSTDAKNNPGIDKQKARQEAYGKAGMPTGKQAGPKAAPKH